MPSRIQETQETPQSPESPFKKKDRSCYEFQDIANVEGWSSMDNDHFMTVNNPGHYDLSFGQFHNSTAVDDIVGINDKNIVNYMRNTVSTLDIDGINSPQKIRTEKNKLEPLLRPFVSFSQF
jgi:hypothetical protein